MEEANMQKCPGCGAEMPENVKFCQMCGASLTPQKRICKKCGAEAPDNVKFCQMCGIALTPPVTQPASAPTPQPAPAPDPQPSPQPAQASAPQPVPQPAQASALSEAPVRKKKGRALKVLRIVVAVALVYFIIGNIINGNFAILLSNFKKTNSPSPSAPAQPAAPANMVLINGGTFLMGSPDNEQGRMADREGQQRSVSLSSFYMGIYQITQAEYEPVMGANPSRFKGPNLPVENVSWYDAVEYCNRLSQREGLTPAYTISGTGDNLSVSWDRNANGYRLPTEAEWEYACRAGTTTTYSTGNTITTDQANFNGAHEQNYNAEGIFRETTTPVGSFAPNPWGLYDMHGNVWEWCWDWYGPYPNTAETDPVGPSSGTLRVFRGGSWYNPGGGRSAMRNFITPSREGSNRGFRLVRPVM